MLSRSADNANDARLLVKKDWIELGEEAVASFFFVYGDAAARPFRKAEKFFLWDGKIIGEAIVI
ncbi:hypothetical protein [Erythrobacter sp. YT30]|uniref:hypothetical protein n=1 Tax=Erythrobacter sp. YT30 TaxID=1735012 RepID=UPI00076D6557|nr:hypothetical protein [Erythrobacter sp. YT30]KWV93097.1 hypothetical protein AUC45_02950 [Erythrobacter sp. YT30]